MKERHQLLKVGGICFLILGIVDLIYGIALTVLLGQGLELIGSLGEMAGLGGSSFLMSIAMSIIGRGLMVFTIIFAALYVIIGFLGFKGNSLTACKVLGIIVLVLTVINFIFSLGFFVVLPLVPLIGFIGILGLLALVLSILYVIGAFKSVKE